MIKRAANGLIWAALTFPAAVFADNDLLCQGAGGSIVDSSGNCTTSNGRGVDRFLADKIGTISNLLLYIAGAIAVIVIIIGGIRYVTSTGDAARVKQAKDTVLYAVVGLVVAILAWAIVNFVARQF